MEISRKYVLCAVVALSFLTVHTAPAPGVLSSLFGREDAHHQQPVDINELLRQYYGAEPQDRIAQLNPQPKRGLYNEPLRRFDSLPPTLDPLELYHKQPSYYPNLYEYGYLYGQQLPSNYGNVQVLPPQYGGHLQPALHLGNQHGKPFGSHVDTHAKEAPSQNEDVPQLRNDLTDIYDDLHGRDILAMPSGADDAHFAPLSDSSSSSAEKSVV